MVLRGFDMARRKEHIDPILSQRIKSLRKEHKITQEELAAKINVTAQTIRKYEDGKHGVPYPSVVSIAKVLKCPLDYLLDLTDCTSEEEYKAEQEAIDAWVRECDPIIKQHFEKLEHQEAVFAQMLDTFLGYKLKRSSVLIPWGPSVGEEAYVFHLTTPDKQVVEFSSRDELQGFYHGFLDDVKKVLKYHLYEYNRQKSYTG